MPLICKLPQYKVVILLVISYEDLGMGKGECVCVCEGECVNVM